MLISCGFGLSAEFPREFSNLHLRPRDGKFLSEILGAFEYIPQELSGGLWRQQATCASLRGNIKGPSSRSAQLGEVMRPVAMSTVASLRIAAENFRASLSGDSMSFWTAPEASGPKRATVPATRILSSTSIPINSIKNGSAEERVCPGRTRIVMPQRITGSADRSCRFADRAKAVNSTSPELKCQEACVWIWLRESALKLDRCKAAPPRSL